MFRDDSVFAGAITYFSFLLVLRVPDLPIFFEMIGWQAA